ncbi:hypothetical protein CORC01_12544 [Colletotrichum orchidophilum]|uniref:Uncharacterized protein n=1 Tax=Colletotrichum orchidophilum TaxID=1209926 RepID=A0A1G4ASR2_9PEZI|nr:uncharacterized protein CORC01_12544 [Colletotrichum orchidophilum]OHE92141.1 hypothetical protein CORC01_12544 [Colletotrichum orchidophilum]
MSSPYTIPYKAGSAAVFVPGAASHPASPKEHAAVNMQGGRQPAVAGKPDAADTSCSKGEPVTVAGGPKDAIPAKFASAVAAAAGGGIAIVTPGGLQGVGGSAPAGATSGSGQSDQGKKSEAIGLNIDVNRTPFGSDGCDEDYKDGMPLSPTTTTKSAQRHATRALPVFEKQLQASRAEIKRLRSALSDATLVLEDQEIEKLRAAIIGYQKSCKQLETQCENLYQQTHDLQSQAQRLHQERDGVQFKNRRLQDEIHSLRRKNTDAMTGIQILTDMTVAMYNMILDNCPEILSSLPERVQKTVEFVHEEWKDEQYQQCFFPNQLAPAVPPYNLVPYHTPVPIHGSIDFIPFQSANDAQNANSSQHGTAAQNGIATQNDISTHDGTSTHDGNTDTSAFMPFGHDQQFMQEQRPRCIPNHSPSNENANIYLPGHPGVFRLVLYSPGEQTYEARNPNVESPQTPSNGGPSNYGPFNAGPYNAGPANGGPSNAGPSDAGPSNDGTADAGTPNTAHDPQTPPSRQH